MSHLHSFALRRAAAPVDIKDGACQSCTRHDEYGQHGHIVVGTGSSEQQVVDRGGRLADALEVGGIEGYSPRCSEFARYVLKPFGISRGERERRPFGSRSPGSFEPDNDCAPESDFSTRKSTLRFRAN